MSWVPQDVPESLGVQPWESVNFENNLRRGNISYIYDFVIKVLRKRVTWIVAAVLIVGALGHIFGKHFVYEAKPTISNEQLDEMVREQLAEKYPALARMTTRYNGVNQQFFQSLTTLEYFYPFEELYEDNLKNGKAFNFPKVLRQAIYARGKEFAAKYSVLSEQLGKIS